MMKQKDLEMLPAWVGESSRTVSFFEWLMEESVSPWDCPEVSIVKVLQGNFYFLYSGSRKGRVLGIGNALEFAGIFNRKDCGLYDLKETLRKILGIRDTFSFPEKADALKEAQKTANQKAFQMTGQGFEELLLESGCEKEKLIPQISRSEMKKRAEEYYREGRTEEEICFRPKVPVAEYFSDHCYLMYLTKKEWVAERIARRWVLKNAEAISRQRIRYGCIQNEFQEIKKAAEKKKQ